MKDRLLWGILGLALVLRVAGIAYGLPLTVVGDEPPFVLAALQMIQLHTVIPALHLDAFKSVLYYPPYISYLYLLPFVAAIGVKWLLWHGGSALFPSYLLSDLSVFFEIGRAFMIVFGTASIYLVYKIAESIYKSKVAARISAFLLATSILHISLSTVGRHWMPVSFLFILVFFILTRERFSVTKRLAAALLVVGFGAGVSTVSLLILIPIGLWFFCLSGMPFMEALRQKWLWVSAVVSAFLVALPSFLYPGSQGALAGGFSLFEHKSISDLLMSPFHALLLNAYSEPVLVFFFLAGAVSLWFYNRQWFFFAAVFFVSYIFAFYLLFEFQPRFMLPMILLYVLVAPAAYLLLKQYRFAQVIFILLLLIPLCTAIRVSYLAFQNDSRANAREWMLEEAKPNDKIVVYGNLLRISTNAQGVAALRAVDPAAVRKTDTADESLDKESLPLVLNLSNAYNDTFFSQLPVYTKQNGYTYAVIQEGYGEGTSTKAMSKLLQGAQEIARFEGFGETSSIAESAFTDPLPALFENKYLGPTVSIYRLP